MEELETKAKRGNPDTLHVSLKVLRLRFLFFKLSRSLGVIDREVDVAQLEKVSLKIFSLFMQAMESHPSVQSTVGVALFHSNTNRNNTLTDLDMTNAIDLLVISV